MSRSSKVTANVYIGRLGNICSFRNTTPVELMEQGKQEHELLRDFLMDIVTVLEKQGMVEATSLPI